MFFTNASYLFLSFKKAVLSSDLCVHFCSNISMREKCPNAEFSGPYLDTFHAVTAVQF